MAARSRGRLGHGSPGARGVAPCSSATTLPALNGPPMTPNTRKARTHPRPGPAPQIDDGTSADDGESSRVSAVVSLADRRWRRAQHRGLDALCQGAGLCCCWTLPRPCPRRRRRWAR